MIIRVIERQSTINSQPQVVRVVRVYNYNVPNGLNENAFTAKGDIPVGADAGDYIMKPVGTDGLVLMADSAEAGGVKWGSPTLGGTVSPSQITSNQNNYNPTGLATASGLRLTSDAARDITGLAAQTDGKLLFIHNVGSYAITLKDESGSSTAANRFALTADVAIAADQLVILQYETTSARWRVTSAGARKTIQIVNTQTGAYATGTATIPLDNTIPQNTEGNQFMTLAITPSNASNLLIIDVVAIVGHSTAAASMMVALFQDSTANALALGYTRISGAATSSTVTFRHYMTAGTTSATTFNVRAGSATAGTTYINGEAGALWGGVAASSITIKEVSA